MLALQFAEKIWFITQEMETSNIEYRIEDQLYENK